MRFRKAILLITFFMLLLSTATAERNIPRMQREIIRSFGRLPVQAPGLLPDEESGLVRIEERSERLLRLISGDSEIDVQTLSLYSATQFFLDLATRPETIDSLPLFHVSKTLGHRLDLQPTRKRHSYSDLTKERESIRTLRTNDNFLLFPAESIELKRLDCLLTQYEMVRDIFRLGRAEVSLSQYLTELIAFLPEGQENNQNKLEELPYDEEIVTRYLAIRETLIREGPRYGLVPTLDRKNPQYKTLETTVIDSANEGLLNPMSMWFAEFYDAYRSEDFLTAQQVLNMIIDATPTIRETPRPTYHLSRLLAKVFKIVAVICALASILMAFLALQTGKRAGVIAIILAMVAWGYHLGWLVFQYRTEPPIAWFQLPLLLSVLGLLPLLGLKNYHPAPVLGGILLSGTLVLLVAQLPSLVIYPDAFTEFPVWILGVMFAWQLTGIFAAGVICQMLLACVVVYRSSRVLDDQRVRLRQLMNVSLPLLRVAMLALLLSISGSIILYWLTPGWHPVGYVGLASSLAILIQCGVFLQLRWINRMDIAGLCKNHITLLILSFFLILSFGDATLAYFPDDFVTRFPSMLKFIVFAGGGITILTLYTLPAINRITHWVRDYRNALQKRKKKTKSPSK